MNATLDCVVLIPAYNEEKKIGGVVQEVVRRGYKIVVIDDGSSDGTAKAAENAGAGIVVCPVNQGKGAAIRAGFDWAIKSGAQGVVIMDADDQHHPDDLQAFIQALCAGGSDIVVGNRMSDPQGMPFTRRCTNRLMSLIVSWAAGQSVPDSQCGYRALTRRALERLQLRTDRFEIESEMLMQAGRRGLKITSVPIASVYRDETSHIRPLRDTFRFFKFLFQFILFPY